MQFAVRLQVFVDNCVLKLPVLAREVYGKRVPEYGDRAPASFDRTEVCRGIDALGQTTDYYNTNRRELAG